MPLLPLFFAPLSWRCSRPAGELLFARFFCAVSSAKAGGFHGAFSVKSMWDGINFETFDFEKNDIGSVGESYDLFDDKSIELVRIPGHTNGLTAVKINVNEKFVLLYSDGGYAKNLGKK